MTFRAKLMGSAAVLAVGVWLPLSSFALHYAVHRAVLPSWATWFPVFYYWRTYWHVPSIRFWVPICAAGVGGALALLLALFAAVLWSPKRRKLVTAEPGEPVPPPERAKSGLHGAARWLSHAVARTWDRKRSHGGVVLGVDDNGDLVVDSCDVGSGHVLTIGGSGANKTSSFSIPTAVPKCGWKGPLFVLDTAGEIAHMTEHLRQEHGQQTFILRPGNGVGFNVLDSINVDDKLATVDITSIIDAVGMERKDTNTDPMWKESGKTIQSAVMHDMLWDPSLPKEQKTIETFAKRCLRPSEELQGFMRDIKTGSQSEMARWLAGSVMDAPDRTWSGYYSDVRTDLRCWLIPAYAAMVSGNSFPSDVLARGNATVYLEISKAQLRATPQVAKTILNAMFEALYRHKGMIPQDVLFLLEDAYLLRRMEPLADARDNLRKARGHLALLLQSEGQLRDIWGEGGLQTWLNGLTQIWMNAEDKKTAEEVAEMCGSFTGLGLSETVSSGRNYSGSGGGSNRGNSYGLSEVKAMLVHPSELRTKRIVFRPKAEGALVLGDPVWWERQECAGVRESPYPRSGAA